MTVVLGTFADGRARANSLALANRGLTSWCILGRPFGALSFVLYSLSCTRQICCRVVRAQPYCCAPRREFAGDGFHLAVDTDSIAQKYGLTRKRETTWL
jgi:hypothetical protein